MKPTHLTVLKDRNEYQAYFNIKICLSTSHIIYAYFELLLIQKDNKITKKEVLEQAKYIASSENFGYVDTTYHDAKKLITKELYESDLEKQNALEIIDRMNNAKIMAKQKFKEWF